MAYENAVFLAYPGAEDVSVFRHVLLTSFRFGLLMWPRIAMKGRAVDS